MVELFWQFLIYSFLGFLLEVVFARLTRSNKQDRKCMILFPLCPVYGLGALAIVHLPVAVQNRPLLLFLLGALAATAVEYVVDWFYETVLGVRFWDYSSLPWNLNGRVSLLFSGFWGLLALSLVIWVHPWVERLFSVIPLGLTFPIFLLFLTDGALSAWTLRTTGTTDSLRWYDHFRTAKKKGALQNERPKNKARG